MERVMEEEFFVTLAIGVVLAITIMPIIILVILKGVRRDLRAIRDQQSIISERITYLKNHILMSTTSTPQKDSTGETLHTSTPIRHEVKEPDKTTTPAQQPAKSPPPPQLPPLPSSKSIPSVIASPSTPSVTEQPKKKSKLAESAHEILRKTWNWILVGEEFRPTGVTSEYAIASTWLLRVGILAIVMCVAYFLKWSVQRNLIPNTGRVAISIGIGISMLVSGMKLLGKKYHIIGQGLLGGGVLVLYFSVYAASPMMYSLVAVTTAFALMIFVTVTAGLLSIRTNSLLIAVIGIAGGYITPVLMKSSDPNLTILYAYILLLSLGILAISHYKQWRLLNYLGFIFTYSLFIGSMSNYDKTLHFPIAISFLTAFFVIHSSVAYIYNIVKKKRSSILELIHLVANAGAYAITAYYLIENAHGRPYPAIMSIALACFFTAHLVVFLRKRIEDRNLLMALIALAGIFTAWTLPLVFEKESLTISISLFAVMILWLGQKLNSSFMQNLAYLAYITVFYRLIAMDMPRNFHVKMAPDITLSLYWKEMVERLWTFGTSIASIIAAFLMQKNDVTIYNNIAVSDRNDIKIGLQKNTANKLFYWIAIFFVFIFLNLELNSMFFFCQPMRAPVLTILWCCMCGYFLWKFINENDSIMLNVMSAFLCLAFLKVFIYDMKSWHFCESMIYNMEYSLLYAGMRTIDFGSVLLMMILTWYILGKRNNQKNTAVTFGYSALFLFFVYTSLETNSLLYWKQPDFQQGGVSVLWAIFAISFIGAGIWKNLRPLRFIGLILFVIVAGKVFLWNLADMAIIYKVIAFMVLGVTLLLGAFAYIHSNKKFINERTL